ncbi:MAG TPA: VCBS repeat-containing protein [Kofleriaceae bacterium]
MRERSLLAITLLVLLGCKQSSEPASSASRSPATPPTAQPPAGEDLAEKMRYCPVTLPGVNTEIEDIDRGVRFVLRAQTAEVVAEARHRAHLLAEFTAGRGKEKHGGGKGGGFMRNCPIITRDASVTAEDIPEGVRLTVAPDQQDQLAEFRTAARARLARAPLERATVVREESSAQGETRLYSGGVADLDGDGTLELVAGGFSGEAKGRRSTILVYRQHGESWEPLAEAGWDDGAGSTVRNVQIADVDGDGRLDIVALGRVGPTSHEAKARLAVFDLQDGKLVERAEIQWQSGRYTHGYGLAVADLDGDGKPEIATGGFQFDGTRETGYVRVWSMSSGKLELRAQTTLDGQGSPSMRVNDLAIGDVDGDGRPEILVAGRHGPLKTEDTKENLDNRREVGDLSVLTFARDKLAARTRYSWARSSSLRLRTVVVADLDGDRHNEIVAGGQYDADGKPCLGLFGFEHGKLVLRDDASSTADGVTGEVKDLVVAGQGADARVLATGVAGDKPGRHGNVAAWRLDHGKLVTDASVVSRNGEETRARAIVVVPGATGPVVLTIGHAKNRTAMIGQVLQWHLADLPKQL